MTSLLVTGASGFIGRSVAESARKAGMMVTPWARRTSDAETAEPMLSVDEMTAKLLQLQPDFIVHCAGPASVAAATGNIASDLSEVVGPLSRLLEAVARSCRPSGIVLVSSAAVYGAPELLPINEATRLAPISAYGFHKLAAEIVAEEFTVVAGLPIIAARVFSTFGHRQRRLLIWELAEQVLRGSQQLVLKGTGLERRDYLPVETLSASLLTLAATAVRGSFSTVNVASGVSVSTLEVANLISDLSGLSKPAAAMGNGSNVDPAHWEVDTSMLRRLVPSAVEGDFRTSLEACLRSWGVAQPSPGVAT